MTPLTDADLKGPKPMTSTRPATDQAPADTPFVLACPNCEAGDDIENEEQAIARGWRGIVYDDGPWWYFLGWCPDCGDLP